MTYSHLFEMEDENQLYLNSNKIEIRLKENEKYFVSKWRYETESAILNVRSAP